ncbi:MAG: hypothetical protein JW829_04725 [Pirellulales bacterium]|nr:hypothetical protein [Pirellulales bacterium]
MPMKLGSFSGWCILDHPKKVYLLTTDMIRTLGGGHLDISPSGTSK